jgi:peptidoglycan/LPS O-acetylase OafA/YrhL
MANGTAVVARRAEAPAKPTQRLTALDGLRGIAALVVVVHHASLTWPALYAQYRGPNHASKTFWLAYSPLHLLWAGREAVTVFFILSGFVLVLPYLKTRKASGNGTWIGYVVRRMFRLYPPVVVALILSAALVKLFPRTVTPGATSWYARHNVDMTWTGLFHDMALVDGTGFINTVLWSLRWEVWFSLLLPLVVIAARRMPRQLWITLPLAIGVVEVGQYYGTVWSLWMPIFLVGVVMAVGRDDLRRLGELIESINSSIVRVGIWAGLVLASGALILAEWVLRLAHSYGIDPGISVLDLPALVSVGGALACFIVLGWPAAERIFSGGFLQWAGRISFSLYLVHEPIVVSLSSLLPPGTISGVLTIVVGGGISILVAMLLHRFVEAPSTRIARDIGKAIDRRNQPRAIHVPYRHDTGVIRRPALPPLPPLPRVPAEGGRPRGLVDSR